MTQARTRIEAVAHAAGNLVAFLHEPPTEGHDAVSHLHLHLATLYTAAVALGSGGDDFGTPDLDEIFPVSPSQLRLVGEVIERMVGERRWYWLRYDPIIPRDGEGELICGDLVDDLQDIYREFLPALRAWESGSDRLDDIQFDWGATPFRSHWGIHAVQAMHALHWINFQHGLPDSAP